MQFHIGAHVVTLSITHRRVPEGKLALAVFRTHEILISARLPAERRYAALLHELVHAWRWWVPAPENEENLAQLMALIAPAADADLAEQGGRAALEALAPCDEPLPEPEVLAVAAPSRRSCRMATAGAVASASGGGGERRVKLACKISLSWCRPVVI